MSQQEMDMESLDSSQAEAGEGLSESSPSPPDAPEAQDSAAAEAAPETREQQLERELEELKDKYLRMLAETDNFKKRLAREREEERSYAAQETVFAFLPVADNLERTLVAAREASAGVAESLLKGLELVQKQFEDALRRSGAEVLPCEVGKPFDPNLHQALFQEDRADLEEGLILEVLQKGYRMAGRLLRPAMVKVSRKP